MAQYSEPQKRAIDKYRSDKVQINLTLTKEQAERYRTQAQATGKSLTKYITDILDEKGE